MESPPNPQLWLLAGGNGAGKSTYYERFLKPGGMIFVNADLVAREINPSDPESVSYEAAQKVEAIRLGYLEQSVNFAFETVFSHPSKIDFVARAKALGYSTVLVYIHLVSIELNQARVSQRVAQGGHSVPPDKVASRIPRTVDNIRQALPLFDQAYLYDNSSATHPHQLVAQVDHGHITRKIPTLPEWAETILEGVVRG